MGGLALMAGLTFASFLQGPLGEAIQASDNFDLLPPATFAPEVDVVSTVAPPETIAGPPMRLLGPGDVTGLAAGTVVRTDPPAGAVDVEPNYMAVAEVVPAELPWVLTPAKAAGGRLRPWFVLVVLEAATSPLLPGPLLPVVDADVAQLPDLRDSWGWAHVQRTTGTGTLPAGGTAAAATLARLVCPRRLAEGVGYRACLVPAFESGRLAGLGRREAAEAPHDLAWHVERGGTVELPVYHAWTFTTGPSGDFEELVTRLEPADPEALRVSSVRPVDVRAPWPGDTPLAEDPQVVGVQGALVPFEAPPAPEHAVSDATLAEFDRRIRGQLDAPARRLLEATAGDTESSLAPPLYGGRHVNQDLVAGDQRWLAQLNASIANRIAAGLGASYVRANQEDLMAKAWQQVGAIREANRRRAIVELTTEVAEKVHERHVAPLHPGEVLALAAPASARLRTSATTTLAMETRMSRMADGTASTAFSRRVRPAGKLARRASVSVRTVIPRALAGEVAVPAAAPVIPDSPTVPASAATAMAAEVAATQLVALTAFAEVAAVNHAGAGAEALSARIGGLRLGDEPTLLMASGGVRELATSIAAQVETVSALTGQVLADMATGEGALGSVSPLGVAIVDTDIARRVSVALQPGGSHHARLDSQTSLPPSMAAAGAGALVMAYPDFPVPTALALLETDPEWLVPGLGALAANKVALLRPNGAFVESYLVGMNHEMMRELLWREYPTDRRGTPFTRFWPRPDGTPDIPPVDTWTDERALGARLTQADGLTVLLVRGEVLRRYPGTVVTAVRSAPADAAGRLRPDPAQPAKAPTFVISIDDSTTAFAFEIPSAELTTPPSAEAPGWFFVLAEHGFRLRFGFDEPPGPDELIEFASWDHATWPTSDGLSHPAFVPVARGHAVAGLAFEPPPGTGADGRSWNRDAADIARITLQRPFRVAIQAGVLLRSADGG